MSPIVFFVTSFPRAHIILCLLCQTVASTGRRPRARCRFHVTSFLGKFSGRKGRECRLKRELVWVPLFFDDSFFFPKKTRALESRPRYCLRLQQSYAIHTKLNGTIATASLGTSTASLGTPPLFGVHDPAWWWVKASNLEGPGGPVVQFNLAHVSFFFRYWYFRCTRRSWNSVIRGQRSLLCA